MVKMSVLNDNSKIFNNVLKQKKMVTQNDHNKTGTDEIADDQVLIEGVPSSQMVY